MRRHGALSGAMPSATEIGPVLILSGLMGFDGGARA